MKFDLPWFPAELMPNKARTIHYQQRGKIAKAYKEDCAWVTKKQLGNFTEETIPMIVTFYPPDNRRRDLDGCLSAVKPAIDFIADMLRIDDYRFRPITIDVGEKVRDGKVVIELREHISEF